MYTDMRVLSQFKNIKLPSSTELSKEKVEIGNSFFLYLN